MVLKKENSTGGGKTAPTVLHQEENSAKPAKKTPEPQLYPMGHTVTWANHDPLC